MNVPTLRSFIDEVSDKPKLILDYIEYIYEKIEKAEPIIRAYITVRPKEDIIRDAKSVIEKMKSGNGGKLRGALIAIKDNIVTKGLRTTCASKILYDFIPPYNATVVERILAEDGIIIGKTNMDEFAMGSTTENSAFFPTRNPWDVNRVPGGSSGGSAAAVAALEAIASLGSDTGGSVRAPAAFTATVGLKPTYGLVSRYGLIAYASSMDQIGPICRTVVDTAILLDVIAGRDGRDATCVGTRKCNYLEEAIKGLNEGSTAKLVVIEEMVSEGVESVVRKSFERSLRRLESNGFLVDWVSEPIVKYALPTYYIIAMGEASSNLARYDGLRYGLHHKVEGLSWCEVYSKVRSEGFGKEVKRRVLVGTFVLSAGYYDAYYLRASKVRRVIRDRIKSLLNQYDYIVSPTMPVVPPKLGERIVDPLKLYAIDIDTVVANLVGLPAISVPSDFVDGLPIGFQVMGDEFSECNLLRVSSFIESIFKISPTAPSWVIK